MISRTQTFVAVRSYLVPIGCCALVLFLTAWLTWRQLERTQMLREGRVSLESYIEGTASRPFCYRVLVPTLLRVVTPLLAHSSAASSAIPTEIAGDSPQPSPRIPGAYAALAVILAVSLLAYAVVMGRMYGDFFSTSKHAISIGSVGALVFLVPFVTGGVGHVYDFPVLMFHAAMLLCIAHRRVGLYLVLFSLSCANKETSVLMIFAFAACLYDCLPRRKFVVCLLLQVGLFLFVYASVTRSFQDNAGTGMEFWLFNQVPLLGSRWKRGIVLPLVIAAMVAYGWSKKPVVFRRAMFMLVPHLALYVCGACPGEVRNLYESVPLLALMSISSVELVSACCAGPR